MIIEEEAKQKVKEELDRLACKKMGLMDRKI